jgi:hypothetical protein
MVREICLQLNVLSSPWHAIQLTGDRVVESIHGSEADVVEVNSQGEIIKSYKNQLRSTSNHRFLRPRHLASDENNGNIFVADRNNNRIVMLSPSSEWARELTGSVDGRRLYLPLCVYFDESSLYVGEDVTHDDEGIAMGGRIFVFDIRRCSSKMSVLISRRITAIS